MTHVVLDQRPSDLARVHRRSRRSKWISAGLAVALVAVGFSSMSRPAAREMDAPLIEFSAQRALTLVDQIAVEPHPMGSAAIVRVREFITEQLIGMGLEPELQGSEVPDYFGAPGDTASVVNVMARIPGTRSSTAIALVAHYDTDPMTPGANDNSVAVAVLLEAGRAILAGNGPEGDVILLFTDAEEPNPRFGATAFAGHPWFDQVGLVVNLEAIGSSGPSLLVETSRPETGVVDGFIRSAEHPVVFSFLPETVNLFGGVGTDFDMFKEAGVPGLSFAYLRGSTIYHTDRDSVDNVSPASVQHHGENVLAVVRAFGAGEPQPDGADEVYFAVTPFSVVHYSAIWAVVMSAILGVAFGALTVFTVRRRQVRMSAIGRGSAVLLVGSLAAGLVAYAAWWMLTAVRSTMGVWESYAYFAVVVALAALVLAFVGGAVAGRFSDSDLATGIVAVWVLLAVATAVSVPGFSYLFFWPALAALPALVWRSSGRSGNWLWLIVAAPAVILTIPVLDVFFQMAQPRPGNLDSALTETAAVVAWLAAMVIGLIVPFLSKARRGS
jgi:hypothetical protein